MHYDSIHERKTVDFKTEFDRELDGNNPWVWLASSIPWDAFNESSDLINQVEKYKEIHGHCPERVLADPLYGTRENRKWLQDREIRYCGKPLGRPRKATIENKAELKQEKQKRQADYRERIPIEGKFGQGKNGYATVLYQDETRKNQRELDQKHLLRGGIC